MNKPSCRLAPAFDSWNTLNALSPVSFSSLNLAWDKSAIIHTPRENTFDYKHVASSRNRQFDLTYKSSRNPNLFASTQLQCVVSNCTSNNPSLGKAVCLQRPQETDTMAWPTTPASTTTYFNLKIRARRRHVSHGVSHAQQSRPTNHRQASGEWNLCARVEQRANGNKNRINKRIPPVAVSPRAKTTRATSQRISRAKSRHKCKHRRKSRHVDNRATRP